ncbi:MAG TPA: sigma-70 family RNA polymerase sigma factor [Chloroflexota bacterium]|nr:sigma-70 family RNA polymerase sigma factor [Chloroflexota bacterium]
MDQHDWLAEQFEANRPHLRSVAYRMLGSLAEADDAVQESWLHLSRAGTSDVKNLGGWLTTIVARVCLDMLRARESRREESLGERTPDPIASREGGVDPEYEAVTADSVGLALLVVLETLAPPERLAFVLHDLFGVSFEEIAPIVGRSPTAARQLASRARRRVQGAGAAPDAERARAAEVADVDRARQREIVAAFLAAARGGDFEALLALLDPEVVFRADAAAVKAGSRVGVPAESRGALAVAGFFSKPGNTAQLALIDGAAGSVWAPDGRPRAAFAFTIARGKVVAIEMVVDPRRLRQLEVTILSP